MVLAIVLLLGALLIHGQTLPPIEAVMEQAITATAEQSALLPEFTFDLAVTWQEFDKNGKQKSITKMTGETYMSAMRNLDISLVVNGKPLREKDVQKSRDQAVKQLEQDYEARRQRTAGGKTVRNVGSQFEEVRVEAEFIFKNCPLSNLRAVSIQGRAAYALDFAPCTAKLKDPFRYLAGVRGTFWIDQETHVIFDVKSWLASDGTDAEPWFEAKWQLFPDPDRLWVPDRVYFHFASSPKLFDSRVNLDWKVSNPKRFVVTTKDSVTEPDLVK